MVSVQRLLLVCAKERYPLLDFLLHFWNRCLFSLPLRCFQVTSLNLLSRHSPYHIRSPKRSKRSRTGTAASSRPSHLKGAGKEARATVEEEEEEEEEEAAVVAWEHKQLR